MEFTNGSLFLVFGVLLCITGCLTKNNKTVEIDNESFMINMIWECARTEDITVCLKAKAANFLRKLVEMKDPLPITDYISLTRDPKVPDPVDPEISNRVEEEVFIGKSSSNEKNDKLNKIIWDRLSSLLSTRTIQLSVPGDAFEGRGDKIGKIGKKGNGLFLMAAMMGGMMYKMALGKIALIAGKALIVGKIALVISLILALKKFAGGGGGGGHSEVVYTSAEHGGFQRNFNEKNFWEKNSGADLAYNAYHERKMN